MISSDSETSFVDSEAEEKRLEQEIFVDTMLEAINRAAPQYIFNAKKSNKKRRQKKMKRIIPQMMRSIWLNYTEFVSTTTTTTVPTVRTPVINWSQVNRRAMENLPQSQPYPVHSCSQDPEFYKEHIKTEFGQRRVVPAKHSIDNPFGYRYGYMTQYGVVSVGILPAPVHGYTHDPELGWVLHARYPEVIKREREEREQARRYDVKNHHLRRKVKKVE